MDMQRPDIETEEPPDTGGCSRISSVVLRCLLRILSTTLPVSSGDSAEIAAEKWELARALFFAMEPMNPTEAMLAARAVAAQFATLDLYARAARSGMPDDKVLRLRAKAIAESRSADAALRELNRRHAQAAKAAAAAEKASAAVAEENASQPGHGRTGGGEPAVGTANARPTPLDGRAGGTAWRTASDGIAPPPPMTQDAQRALR